MQQHYRTSMSIKYITTLLDFCLRNTYFLFQGKYYEQVHWAAMGLPISPIMANLFMEEFETKAINSATQPPKLWLSYVDDTFVIQSAKCSNQFPQHINSIDPHIQFTQETPNTDGIIPFLDILFHLDQTIPCLLQFTGNLHRPVPSLGQPP